ncbi:unnamed protein product [Rhizophagus irregularis]|nr:unnamed protein product [Rhizophagus irregularis]
MDQQIKEENKIQNYCLNEISKVLATLKSKKLKTIKELLSNLPSLIQPYKLSMIEPSKQAVLNNDDVRWNISLYEGQPFVYTSVNDRNDRSSRVNLLNFNSDDKLVESPRPSDVCINFPVAEITFTADLSESFSNFMNNDDRKLYELHDHLFPIRILIGDKLFINGLELVNSKQIGIFYSYLTWARDSAKNKKETPFNNLVAAQNFFPKIIIITTNGINLDTHEKLTDWMNNLYQDDADKISNNNLVQLKFDTTSFADKKQHGVDNFKEELTLQNWVKYSKYVRWVKEFRLFQGLIIDQNFELKICKEKAIDLIDFPNVESSDKFYLEMVKPTTILEEILINNNILSANSNEDISSFPFIKVSDDPSYQDNVYFLVKCERYKISLSKDNIKPSEKLKKDIDKALESMTPLICLQKVFDKYGWFIPLNILLGKSLKNNIIGNSSNISKKIDFALPVFESLAPHLTDYGINCLITHKGEIIEENDLPEWIQNAEDDLEVIELNNIIPLYNILEVEQTKRIDTVLNEQDKVKIIMTGSIDLKDLDITEQITISIEPSLDNKNYEVFGSIASKNNSKLDDIFVTFGSYEINEFSATIVTSKNTHISIEECYIIWMIIGNPSELSVFYPNNREVQVGYFKSAITLQRNNPSYSIKTSHQLSQGYDISIKCFEPINIELTGWSKNCVYLTISNSSIDFNLTQSNVEVAVCTLSRSNCENSKIDINGIGYSMGYILNENNYREPQLEQTNTQKYLDKQYPIKGDRTNLNELKMTNENLKGHLDLSDFINLEKLDCSNNELTSIDISKNVKLIEIDCSQNNLISLDLSNCSNLKSVTANLNRLNELKLPVIENNDELEYLNLLDNSFSQKLSCFSRLINLKGLHIGNTDESRIERGIYNRFYSSLKPLTCLIKLENLSINDTDIDSGLEHLPESVKIFQCSADKRSDAKVIKIYEQLKTYNMSFNDTFQGRYNLKAWKKNWKLIKENETLQNQIKRIEKLTLDAKFIKLKDENNDLHEKEEKLMKKNNQLGQKLTKLERETSNLKQMVRELNARLKQQYDVHTQTEQQIKEKEKKLGSLIAEKLVEKEELEKEIKALKDDLAANEKDIIESEKLLEEKNKELNIKENETAVLEKKRDKIKSSLSEIEAKKDELGDLKKKLKYEGFFSKASTSELRKKMDDLEKDLKSSQSKKEKLEAEAETIENELEEIRKYKEDLQNEQIEQQAHVETLRKDGKSLQYNLEGKKSSLKEKEEIISDLQQQGEKKIAALNNEIKNKEENLREKEKFICNIQQQSEKKLKEKEEIINELKQQNEKRIAALSNEIKNKEENLREKEKFICNIQQQSEKKLKEKEELINELKQQNEKKITALNNEIKNKEEHIDKLNEETKKCQNLQENFKKKIGDLLSQIQTQQTELSELVNKIDKEYDLGRKGKSLVDNILEQQRNIILTNGDSVSEELGKIKGKLIDVYELTEEKVRDILDKQTEKTKLEMQLKSLINQE